MTRLAFFLPLLALCLSGAASAAEPLAPFTPQQRAVMQAIPEDPAPKVLLGQAPGLENKHYVAGNEWHLYLYGEKLKDLGGAFMGVGSDQCYLLMGMQRPTVAFLTDYDDVVVAIHSLYMAFFAQAATRQEFLDLWQQENVARGVEVLNQRLPATADKKGLTRLYRVTRAKIAMRLARVAKTFAAHKVRSFVSDDDTYAYLRAMVTGGRIRALRVDLLAKQGVLGVGEAARQLGVPLTVVYLSNAENYWLYTPQYRLNIAGLPVNPAAWLVRTVSTWNHNFDYIYNLQPMSNYLTWLGKPWVSRYRDFIALGAPQPQEFRLALTQPDPEQAERIRAARKGRPGAKKPRQDRTREGKAQSGAIG